MLKINELQLAKTNQVSNCNSSRCWGDEIFRKKLKKLGFKTKILEFKEKGFKPVKNLYARLGTKGPNLCYAGHLCCAPRQYKRLDNKSIWTKSVKNGHLIGRGANDMKSSIAAFVSATNYFFVKK